MTCDAREFFKLFFRELEQRGIPYVILHSYAEMPEKISSDIDYAVADADLAKLTGIQLELARQHNWALVQTLHHGVFAFYAVLVSLDDPAQSLRLDACSNYARARRFLVSESVLLGNRRQSHGFYAPAPSAEFIYELAKTFDAKNKPVTDYLPRLRELWLQEPEQSQQYFTKLFGDTGRSLKEWFAAPAEEWRRLGTLMLSRNRFGPVLMLREAERMVRRIFQPTGISLTIMGSDGAGKSTLLENLRKLLEPCFRYQRTFHFRPAVFEKKKIGVVTDPHGQAPRNLLSSWLKVFYYFFDYWTGWMFLVLPARIRSTLIIFDRGFADLLVDEKRYRLKGTLPLVNLFRHSLPATDHTFVLTAPAEVLHQRKPELPMEELARQQKVLKGLASSRKHSTLLSASEPSDEVARKAWREVIMSLAAREAKRHTS